MAVAVFNSKPAIKQNNVIEMTASGAQQPNKASCTHVMPVNGCYLYRAAIYVGSVDSPLRLIVLEYFVEFELGSYEECENCLCKKTFLQCVYISALIQINSRK